MARYVFLSLNVLNGLLVLAVAAVLHFAVIPLLNPVAQITLPAVKGTATSSGEQRAPSQRFPVTDYAVISDKNLFHPARKIPLEKQPEKAIPKPDVFLYGTLITENGSYAFIEDKKTPYSTPGRGKRQITLKKGDRLNGYTLGEVEANRIVLVKGEEKVVVMLDDRDKKRADESPATPSTGRPVAGGITPSPPGVPSSPQVMPSSAPGGVSPRPSIAGSPTRPSPQVAPSSAQAVGSPGPGIAGSPTPPSPQMMPASAKDAPPAKPGIGASGTWPPTRDSVEQTRQKLQDAQQMRLDQLKRSQ